MLIKATPGFPSRDSRELCPVDWYEVRRGALHRARQLRAQSMREFFVAAFAAARDGLAALLRPVIAAVNRWRTVRRDRVAIKHLHALDDCTLKDIGIRRSEIESIIHAHVKDDSRNRNQ